MSRRQLRSSVRWESVIIALLGTLLGLRDRRGVRVGDGAALDDQGIDKFSLAPAQLVLIVVLAALFGILAAALPARRACASLDVLAVDPLAVAAGLYRIFPLPWGRAGARGRRFSISKRREPHRTG